MKAHMELTLKKTVPWKHSEARSFIASDARANEKNGLAVKTMFLQIYVFFKRYVGKCLIYTSEWWK